MAIGSLDSRALGVLDFIKGRKDVAVSVEAIEKNLKISRFEAVEAIKALSAEGLGQYIVGRRNSPTRFVSNRHEISQYLEPAGVSDSKKGETEKIVYEPELVQTLMLRRNPPVPITIPADITPAEAALISKWLSLVSEANV